MVSALGSARTTTLSIPATEGAELPSIMVRYTAIFSPWGLKWTSLSTLLRATAADYSREYSIRINNHIDIITRYVRGKKSACHHCRKRNTERH